MDLASFIIAVLVLVAVVSLIAYFGSQILRIGLLKAEAETAKSKRMLALARKSHASRRRNSRRDDDDEEDDDDDEEDDWPIPPEFEPIAKGIAHSNGVDYDKARAGDAGEQLKLKALVDRLAQVGTQPPAAAGSGGDAL